MIKLYKIFINDITAEEYEREYEKLDRPTAGAVKRRGNESDRKRTLAGRILLRRAVKELFGICDYAVSYGNNGKPELPFCFFNISHSGGLAVLAVSDRRVGADTELVRPIRLRERYKLFSKEESEGVNKSADPNRRFMQIWTKKEAAVKCVGGGISDIEGLSYGDFEFFTEEYGDYVITVCTEKSGNKEKAF